MARALVWCDMCRDLHEAEEGGYLIHVLCPLEPPGEQFWVEPTYYRTYDPEEPG